MIPSKVVETAFPLKMKHIIYLAVLLNSKNILESPIFSYFLEYSFKLVFTDKLILCICQSYKSNFRHEPILYKLYTRLKIFQLFAGLSS